MNVWERVSELDKVERELRDLMHLYDERCMKIELDRLEAKESEDFESEIINECLQRQCRIMRAELFKTMKKLGVLDEEEVLYGGIKNK